MRGTIPQRMLRQRSALPMRAIQALRRSLVGCGEFSAHEAGLQSCGTVSTWMEADRGVRRVKLIYVTGSFPYTVTEVFAAPELTELLRRGHEVRVAPVRLTDEAPSADALPFVERTVRFPRLSARTLRAAAAAFAKSPRRGAKVLRKALSGQSRQVRRHNLMGFLHGLSLAHYARRWGAEHIHAYWATMAATSAMVASEVTGIPWSFTAHRQDLVKPNALAAKVESSSFVRFISDDGLKLAAAETGGGLEATLEDKAVVLRLGVDLVAASPPARPSRAALLRLVCAASLTRRKGHAHLLGAIVRLKARGRQVHLTLAGDGVLRPDLEGLVGELDLGAEVTLLGAVDHTELLGLYAAGRFDAAVLASLHEGIPVALVEAMAYGLPVVGTDVGGVGELLAGDAGLLVPPADPEALAAALGRLAGDAGLRGRLGETGRRRVRAGYDAKRTVQQLELLYEQAAVSAGAVDTSANPQGGLELSAETPLR